MAAEDPPGAGRKPARSIPGYAGFVPGCNAEGVHGTTHRHSTLRAARAVSLRGRSAARCDSLLDGRTWRCGPPSTVVCEPSLDASADIGCSRSRVGAAGAARSAPENQVGSVFRNSRGLGARAGASIPGYAGFIPGSAAGGVFAKTFAQDSLQATQVRHGNYRKVEEGMNWILNASVDRDATCFGAVATRKGSEANVPSTPSSRSTIADGGDWHVWQPEPVPPHRWAR
eukprot:CAMPEP_0175527354 /NCGR_PEP_ID=MMETSP0096-20121207/20084_1 /TAXON_ID=311494 /ORGANISM="Alexandrium monilatum, Strain CCMP3105" /LENGTH=227 /DNA_ID=CAMNT_0016830005 /DNA_START=47 /DNA_END=733 /DNA_ORIENTATION=-